ncbi:restriction endonuclease subunit S [Bacillus massiliigorillae]|uniref:restriction endonuclease subunit S n=1 Tax=Bacillus massiliigorillae TaxID=1243664 RepID=UPI0003A04411|nr:restriction endonuclease subunit S [Bacillus massiliigorillae]
MKYKQTKVGIIPEEWDIEIVDNIKSSDKNAISMGPFGSKIKKENFVDAGVPVIRGNNLKSYHFSESDFVYVTEEKAVELKSSWVKRKDLVITHRGTLGQVGYIPENSNYEKYIVSQSGMKLTCDEEKVNSKFLYYYLNSRMGQYHLLMNQSQVGVPAIAQASTSLKKIPVPIPVLSEQRAIANILSSLDEKIEVNNAINKKLEELAQAIFKQWFVDFEFPNEEGKPYKSSGGAMAESELGMIPEGWEVSSLDKIAGFLNGLAMQKYRPSENEVGIPVMKIKELRQGFTDKNSDICSENISSNYIIQDGDIIFSWSGSLLVDIWCGGICGLNQHLFKVTSQNYDKWFYFQWTRHHLDNFIRIAESKATTMGHIKRKDLVDSKVLVPNEETYEKANKFMKQLFEQKVNLKKQSKRLIELRDTLLPKLMSGEIRVPIEKE